MASYQKRGKTWQFTISRVIDGKQKPIRKGGFRTKKEAQIVANEIEEKLNKGVSVSYLKPTPFVDYFEKWIILYKTQHSKATLTHYKNTLRISKEYFGNIPIQNITKSDYQLFINKLFKGEGKQHETIKKINSQIRACVKDAIDEGIIHIDFTRNVVLAGNKPSKTIDKHLNYDESKKLTKRLLKLIAEQGNLIHYLIYLGLMTGLRFAELVALTRNDFNFKDNTITVNKSWGYLPTSENGAKPTKTPSSERVIKIDNRTAKLFKKLFMSTPDNVDRLIFYNPSSKYKVFSNTGTNKSLKKITKDLKITEITVHGLRHTHASILLYKGISVQYISERLGHADIDTTIRVYTHMIKELREKDEENTIKILNVL